TYTGNIGIVSNAVESPKYVPVTGVGFMDMGLRLNRIAQYARAPYNPATSVATDSPHSYSIMFKTAAIDNGQPNYLWHHEGYNSGMATYGNEFYFSKSNAGGGIFDQVKVTSAIQPNTLYHVVVVNTGLGASGIKIYINGVERTPITLNNNGATGTPTGALVIGVYIGGPYFYFGGVIYHFRKFNVALTPAQVQEEYSTGFIPAELAGNTLAQYEIQEDESQYEILVEQKHNNHATLMGYTPIEIQFSRTDINGN
ncbi:MAG: LamG domain-containing protein, partial [Shewanella sp.]